MVSARMCVFAIVFVSLLVLSGPQTVSAQSFGRFLGRPQTEWNEDGRKMRLLQDFTYEDPQGVRWTAPASSEINGASIPHWLWSLIGGPYEGRYRDASIVHDVECTAPYKHDWKSVHRMFYHAVRAGKADEFTSRLMFAAVYHFGPRWKFNGVEPEPKTLDSEDDFLRLRALIRERPDIRLEELERLTRESLVSLISAERVELERCAVEKERLSEMPIEGKTGGAIWNLGKLRAGCTYTELLRVQNDCAGRPYKLLVRDAPWFSVSPPDPTRLATRTEMLNVSIDLRRVDPGEHEGQLTVRCRRCLFCKTKKLDLRVSVLPSCS